MRGNLGMGGKLDVLKIPAQRSHRARSIRLPGGRLILTRDKGQSTLLANQMMMSNLRLTHRDPGGRILDVVDTGSGLVTNAGVNLMSNDFGWTNATLKQANFHALGTGTTTAALSDVWLQTIASNTNFSGTTNGYMTGTQSMIANATGTPWSPVYQTTATFTCNGGAGIAITEWIVAIGNGANVNNSSTAGVTIATSSVTDTGAAFTTSGTGLAQWTLEGGFASAQTTPTNTSTTPMFQIASNTATVATALSNTWSSGTKTWLTAANNTVANPTNKFYVVFPTAWDHKTFGAVTLNNGDTLQVTYQLSINSGG